MFRFFNRAVAMVAQGLLNASISALPTTVSIDASSNEVSLLQSSVSTEDTTGSPAVQSSNSSGQQCGSTRTASQASLRPSDRKRKRQRVQYELFIDMKGWRKYYHNYATRLYTMLSKRVSRTRPQLSQAAHN